MGRDALHLLRAVEVKRLSVEHNTFAAAPQGTIKQMASFRVIFLY